jgi:guanine nucleotide-exchange factor
VQFICLGIENIVVLSFDSVDKIMVEYFPLIADAFFVECVKCLDAFAQSKHIKDISIRAVSALGFCAEQLAAGKVIAIKPDSDGVAFRDEEAHLKCWVPILTALAAVVSHQHVDVRTAYVHQARTVPITRHSDC